MDGIGGGRTDAGIFQSQVAEDFVITLGQRRQEDSESLVAGADWVNMAEGLVSRLASKEEMEELAVIGRQIEVFMRAENLPAESEIENTPAAFDANVRGEVGPTAIAQALAELHFLGMPPLFSADEQENKNDGGDNDGPPTPA